MTTRELYEDWKRFKDAEEVPFHEFAWRLIQMGMGEYAQGRLPKENLVLLLSLLVGFEAWLDGRFEGVEVLDIDLGFESTMMH